MNIRKLIICLILALVIAFPACGKNYSSKFYSSPQMRKGINKVAVLPFNDLTGSEESGIVSTFFAQHLEKLHGVKVVYGEDLIRQLSLNRVEIDGMVSRLSAARVAQALEVDAVIYGNILEYRYRNWVKSNRGIYGDPVVCVSARLLKGSTGTVVWASTDVRTSYSIFSMGRDPLSGMAEMVVKDLVKSMRLNEK